MTGRTGGSKLNLRWVSGAAHPGDMVGSISRDLWHKDEEERRRWMRGAEPSRNIQAIRP